MSDPPTFVMSRERPVARSTSQAPRLDTTSPVSIPGELTPAFAGQAAAPVEVSASRSKVHTAMGTSGSASVVQSTRQYDARPSRPTAVRKMSAPLLWEGPDG